MSKKYVFAIMGHSCAGKTTLLRKLNVAIKKTYLLSGDRLKKNISNYDIHDESHLRLKEDMVKKLFEVLIVNEFSILFEISFLELENLKWFRDYATRHDYEFILCKLTAPQKQLLVRFKHRLAEGTARGARYVTTTAKDYLQNYRHNKKLFATIEKELLVNQVFDTTEISPDELFETIKKILPD